MARGSARREQLDGGSHDRKYGEGPSGGDFVIWPYPSQGGSKP